MNVYGVIIVLLVIFLLKAGKADSDRRQAEKRKNRELRDRQLADLREKQRG